MSDPEATNVEAISAGHAVIEALIDGEPVDPHALRRALADPSLRDHFVDLLVLREGLKAMAPAARFSGQRRAPIGRLRWTAAAAAIVFSVTAGYYTGQRAVAAAGPQGIETTVAIESQPAAPPATRVIKLEAGVNWSDAPGGK